MDRTRASAAATAREIGPNGVSDVAVLKAAKAGRISRNADGTFDIDKVKLEWAANTSPTRGGNRLAADDIAPPRSASNAAAARANDANTAMSGSLLRARTVRETFEAKSAQLKYEQDLGQLIDRSGVEMANETAWRQIRDAIMAVPDRLPIESDLRNMLRDALRSTLSDAQKMLPTMTAGEPMQ